MQNDESIADEKFSFHQQPSLLLEQCEYLRKNYPELYACVDLRRVLAHATSAFHDGLHVDDFETVQCGGRGELYTSAQRNPLVRKVGITQIFALLSEEQNLQNLSQHLKILDALGGDGVLNRALLKLLPSTLLPSILTSDISSYMVNAAQSYGLPAIQQPVQSLVLKDSSFDAVVIAYGSHHIPLDQRRETCQEAFRILKPGGRIVFHDFENGSPVACWFSKVVHPYSLTGHDFPHYDSKEIKDYFTAAGFDEIRVEYLYDPFVLVGKSPQEAKHLLGEYLWNMYGLIKLAEKYPDQDSSIVTYTLADTYFRYDYLNLGLPASFGASSICISRKGEDWHIEMPRVALVGTAIKPLL